MYRVYAIPSKVPMGFFVEINKLVLKSIWKSKIIRIVKTTLKKNSKVGRLTLPHYLISRLTIKLFTSKL